MDWAAGFRGAHLGEDLLRQAGALEEGDGLLAADAAVLVQVGAAEVGLEGLHPRHGRDPGRGSRRPRGSAAAGCGEISGERVAGGRAALSCVCERGQWLGVGPPGGRPVQMVCELPAAKLFAKCPPPSLHPF